MEQLQVQDTAKATLSKKLYQKWQSPLWRRWMIVLLTAALCASLFTALALAAETKRVTLIVNGQAAEIETRAHRVIDLLEDRHIAVQKYDNVKPALSEELKDGDRVVVEYAKPVIVSADGKTETRYVLAGTVKDAISELKLSLDEDDKVLPSLDAAIAPNSVIHIVRVETEYEERQVAIPYRTVTKEDNSLTKGKQVVVQEGEEGVLVKKIKRIVENGVVVSETVVDENVAKPSTNKLIAVGTKNPVVALSASSPDIQQVTKNGITFSVKKILNNVTLTAYSAGEESTGKDEDHPQYGITYTGTRVTEGRTIAVDPKVIPLGWWVYIEGLGFRRAEDIGGAVKGNKIDVYFASQDTAERFGTKKGYKVYIIGPKKPEA